MKALQSLFLVLATLVSMTAFAAEQVDGSYKGMTFTASINQNVSADITWHDNAETMHLNYTSAPNPTPRCMCDVYQSGPRQLIVERDIRTQKIINVTYNFNQTPAQSTYEYFDLDLEGRTYKVALASDLAVAFIWLRDAGLTENWQQLSYNVERSSHYRCMCRVYGENNSESPLLFVEFFPDGRKAAKLLRNESI